MPRNRDGPRRAVNHVVVTGYEKRRSPSKHYVFIIDITWDNDERHEILRRYSEFFTLKETLKILFPDRAHYSKHHEANYALPPLPKRKFIGRSHVESVAEARLEALNQYCQSLIRMDDTITKCKQVMAFFSPKIGDRQLPKLRLQRPASLHPMHRPAGNSVWEEYCVIAAFNGDGKAQVSAESGDQVILLNKDPSGWWLIERRGKIGWIPSSYLKKSKSDEEECLGLIEIPNAKGGDPSGSRNTTSPIIEAQDYIAIDSYETQGPGQMSFEEGEIITVLDKMEDGWWFVSKDEEEGWVPCGYLEPLSKETIEEDIPISSLDIEQYSTVAPYAAEEEDEVSFPQAVVVEVLQKSLTGWWLVRLPGGTVGLAPATYLKKVEKEEQMQFSSDSGVDSGPEQVNLESSFKQVPRQKTVRKKRSTRGKGDKRKNIPKVIEEAIEEEEVTSKKTENKTKTSPAKVKPAVPPRKSSQPQNEGYKPQVSPKPTTPIKIHPKSHELSFANSLGTPPRPRQSQINRAWGERKNHQDVTYDSDESPEEKPNRKLSRSNARKSPSPRGSPTSTSPLSMSPRSGSPLRNRHHTSLSPPTDDHKSGSEGGSPVAEGSNPFTAQMVDTMLKYILASEDPSLKQMLRSAISSDPKLMESLKK